MGCDETEVPPAVVRVLRDEDAAVEGGFSIVQDDPSCKRSFCASPVAQKLRRRGEDGCWWRTEVPCGSSSRNISRYSRRMESSAAISAAAATISDAIPTESDSFDVSELLPEHVHAAAKFRRI